MADVFVDKSLESRMEEAFNELGIDAVQRDKINGFLSPLKNKSPETSATYEHCIRVGLLARRIGRFMHLPEKPIFYGGILHDIGKVQVPLETLGKTDGWTQQDTENIMPHVIRGYEMLVGSLDFTAELIVRHHQYQKNRYPKELPRFRHDYSTGTEALISMLSRIVTLADVYDAFHRVNDKFEEKKALDEREIREKITEYNPDLKSLVEALYNAGIFSQNEEVVTEKNSYHDQLYIQSFKDFNPKREPRETARLVMLATALEPLSDKAGCTTRYNNLNQFQKLEYFVTGAINIGVAFEDLARRIEETGKQPELIYDLALKAQKHSKRNRKGGRVNQGIIELLTPIVASQHIYDLDYAFTQAEVLEKATLVMKNTGAEDIQKLKEMKRFAFDLSGYFTRPVADHPDARNVFEYYERELEASGTKTVQAHNGEFVNRFPTVLKLCESIRHSNQKELSNKVQDAYEEAKLHLGNEVANGFVADCVAAALYLWLSQNPKEKVVS